MKNIFKFLGIMLILTVLFTGCGKKTVEFQKVPDKTEVKQQEEKEPIQEDEKDEKENETEVVVSSTETDKGVFLGMSDSNFAVIFSQSQKKDVYYAVDRKLNLENSDVEIGDAVSYTYTTDEKDAKTITSIKKIEQ